MAAFSKFLTGKRGSQQLLDTDRHTYNQRKDRTTSDGLTTWRCSKNRNKTYKCPCSVLFNPTDESLSATNEHNHVPDPLVEQKKELITSLKRKAEDQQLSSTQNILTEALSSSTPELNVALPKLESLARVAQRARAKPSVQEYFRAIRDQQVTTDYHIDRLAAGMTPAKKRKTSNHILYKICEDFLEYDSVLSYMFKVAEYFGHEL